MLSGTNFYYNSSIFSIRIKRIGAVAAPLERTLLRKKAVSSNSYFNVSEPDLKRKEKIFITLKKINKYLNIKPIYDNVCLVDSD